MEYFNIIAGICSILGFIVSLVVAANVIKISTKLNQNAKDIENSNITQAGRDINK